MSRLVEDNQSLTGVIIRTYNHLSEVDRDNELLGYLHIIDNVSFELAPEPFRSEFFERYARGETCHEAAMEKYLMALKKAVSEAGAESVSSLIE